MIEVGVDVPNATVMLVEDAERYGISQLHQLRGRVGRGEHRSLCLLFGPKESERLRALAEHTDGFRLAEIDLRLRGEGELTGTRQSGAPAFRYARLPEDARTARARPCECARDHRRRSRPRRARARPAAGRAARHARRDRARRDPRLMRIVAGRFGGRRIATVQGDATRPTTDRVREALFSILGPLDDARVLDLFAGSGALAIEALSRGAAHATLVEKDGWAAQVIARNLETLGVAADEAELLRMPADRALRTARERGDAYDLVFLDPPYRQAPALGTQLAADLAAVLAPDARVVTESDRRAPLDLPLPTIDERRYGDTLIRIHATR